MSQQDEHRPANGSSNGNAPGGSGGERQPVDPLIGDYIGRELRAMFDGVVAERIPEKLRKLIEDLARKEREKG